MAFRIDNFSFANKEIILSEKIEGENDHVFTLITGENAIGKSRLLTSIITFYLARSKKYEFYDVNSILIEHEDAPHRIIAVTNTINDRFPIKKNKSTVYEYFGNKQIGIMRYDKYSFIKKIIMNEEIQLNSIFDTFNYLGFSSYLEIDFRYTIRVNNYFDNELIHVYEDYINLFEKEKIDLNLNKMSENEKLFLNSLRVIHGENNKILKYNDFKNLCEIFLYNKNRNYSLISLSLGSYYHKCSISIENLRVLLKYDILKIRDVRFEKDRKLIEYRNLSSGQQALLNIFLSISSCIVDNSLICIDEPEISLHPEWQIEFIIKLQELFLKYKGCHFIIATHSPQIVSGLKSKNGYIVELGDNSTYKIKDFSKKSADFQLARVFNTPGYNNEYLIRIGLLILSKISQKIDLNNEDLSNLNFLNKAKNEISENDPVYYLIEQINSLVEF